MSAIVLLSGGMDSTICLYWAREHFGEVECVSFEYGQRHRAELESAKKIAHRVGCLHHLVPVTGLEGSYLLGDLPEASPNGKHPFFPELPATFVPGRNALFLLLAAIKGTSRLIRDLVIGVSEEDYSGYYDCREVFVKAMECALSLGIYGQGDALHIHAPLLVVSKAASLAMAALMPGCWEALGDSTTCYEGRRPGCGKCPSCVLRARAFLQFGRSDPAETT